MSSFYIDITNLSECYVQCNVSYACDHVGNWLTENSAGVGLGKLVTSASQCTVSDTVRINRTLRDTTPFCAQTEAVINSYALSVS
jgi:hypothetical protein